MFCRAPSPSNSITKRAPRTFAPDSSQSLAQAEIVPPVASRSSMIMAFCPGSMASSCISREFEPYSSEYSTLREGAGSLPGFLTGTKAHPRRSARRGAKMKPRASGPTTTSGFQPNCLMSSTNWSVMEDNKPGSRRTGVISRNIIPSMGKFGTVRTMLRIRLRSSSFIAGSPPLGKGGATPPLPVTFSSEAQDICEQPLKGGAVAWSNVEEGHQDE